MAGDCMRLGQFDTAADSLEKSLLVRRRVCYTTNKYLLVGEMIPLMDRDKRATKEGCCATCHGTVVNVTLFLIATPKFHSETWIDWHRR